ncbi:hypothetical protein [Mycobacterium parmense]|uniref:LSDAT prokaryote domain-containing protein n=1 Tax=Mycobacterium parmense TaxID=185642 RepID=A0A7I7Z0E3_9MYCO|nr:hypothetical protein [Mycobacterium parmense]MCV7349997.1 hypothetical protein [Mycobacterium parmense]ORW59278.1 hypothetical protein AWC20_10045 [Mycobacterium parmense]BBZ46471.1 hypothetical protein MPRM_37520 [Mycobacterium parmense]
MTTPFGIELSGAVTAPAVRVGTVGELTDALDALGLRPPRPTLVVAGGAAGLEDARTDGLRPVFGTGIVPALQESGAVAIDGGTRVGVMRLLGEARAESRAQFPLVGVLAAGPLGLSTEEDRPGVHPELEPHHTHFLIVPGQQWGAEAPWIARTATALAGSARSLTVLVNGGQIAYSDVEHSVGAGRPVVVISGSGGTAEALAAALAGASTDDRTSALVASGLVSSVAVGEPAALAELLAATFAGPANA